MSRKSAANVSLSTEVGKAFAAKLVQAGFGFVGTIIFARILGPTSFGGFYLILSLSQLSSRPVLGVSNAVEKRYAEIGASRRELLGVLVVVIAASLVVVSIGVAVLRGPLVSYVEVVDAPVLFVVLFTAIASFPIYQNLLTSIGRLSLQTWIDTLRSVTTFSLQFLFVSVGYGAAGMAYGLTLGTVVLIPLTHHYLRTVPAVPTRETVRSVWSFARYSIPAKMLGSAYDRFDVLLLGVLASPAAVGQYEVAYKLTVPATFVAGLSGSGLMAKLSDLDSRDEELREEITNTLAFSSLFAMPLFFGALSVSQTTVVTVYGPEYRSAGVLLTGLALYRVVSTQANVLTDVTAGLDVPEFQLRASAVTLLINVPLGVVLYEQIGVPGVVVATISAEILRYLIMIRYVKRETDAVLLPKALVEQFLAAGVMFVVVELLQGVIVVRSWVDLTIIVTAGGCVYFVLLTVLSRHLRVTIKGAVEQIGSDAGR